MCDHRASCSACEAAERTGRTPSVDIDSRRLHALGRPLEGVSIVKIARSMTVQDAFPP